jgi:hypothetical protein
VLKNPDDAVTQVPERLYGGVCDEIRAILDTVYRSPACLSLEIQATYTANVLARDLIVAGRSLSRSHLEAIVGTIIAREQIGNFKLEQLVRQAPGFVLSAIGDVLDMNVGDVDCSCSSVPASTTTTIIATVRNLARNCTIFSINYNLISDIVNKIISSLRQQPLDVSGGST